MNDDIYDQQEGRAVGIAQLKQHIDSAFCIDSSMHDCAVMYDIQHDKVACDKITGGAFCMQYHSLASMAVSADSPQINIIQLCNEDQKQNCMARMKQDDFYVRKAADTAECCYDRTCDIGDVQNIQIDKRYIYVFYDVMTFGSDKDDYTISVFKYRDYLLDKVIDDFVSYFPHIDATYGSVSVLSKIVSSVTLQQLFSYQLLLDSWQATVFFQQTLPFIMQNLQTSKAIALQTFASQKKMTSLQQQTLLLHKQLNVLQKQMDIQNTKG